MKEQLFMAHKVPIRRVAFTFSSKSQRFPLTSIGGTEMAAIAHILESGLCPKQVTSASRERPSFAAIALKSLAPAL